MKANLRKVRISPKKTNIVAGLVRGKGVTEALDILNFMPRKAAQAIYKAIFSATSNAEKNNKVKKEDLKVKAIVVNKGQVWKRYLPSSRGRALPLRKPTAHISVELEKK
ncbi:50S ribosomal protein L22 [Candidatus Gracilibacteria bacterium]|nr:50S ribosomal protein L22 [Candidatus Gracilibacteria bacterium]